MKKLDNVCFIPPSYRWSKEQLDLYFSLLKMKNVKLVYYWTDKGGCPTHDPCLNKEDYKKWKAKWKVTPFKKQTAEKLPKNVKFSKKYACSKYSLHGSVDPIYWNDSFSRNKLWVAAMIDPIFIPSYSDDYGGKFISQKRIIIGEILKSEFKYRAKLCAETSKSFLRGIL